MRSGARHSLERGAARVRTRSAELARTRRRLASGVDRHPGLFDDEPASVKPRRVVPNTSRQAFREITANGKRSGQMGAILEFLRRQLFPMTSFEIARANDWDRVGV